MKIHLKELKKQSQRIEVFIVESVDLSLYIAHARIDGEERVIAEDDRRLLKRHNLLAMKRILKGIAACEIRLRQRVPTMKWWGTTTRRRPIPWRSRWGMNRCRNGLTENPDSLAGQVVVID